MFAEMIDSQLNILLARHLCHMISGMFILIGTTCIPSKILVINIFFIYNICISDYKFNVHNILINVICLFVHSNDIYIYTLHVYWQYDTYICHVLKNFRV